MGFVEDWIDFNASGCRVILNIFLILPGFVWAICSLFHDLRNFTNITTMLCSADTLMLAYCTYYLAYLWFVDWSLSISNLWLRRSVDYM